MTKLPFALAGFLLVYSLASIFGETTTSGNLSANLKYCGLLPCARELPELAQGALSKNGQIDDSVTLAAFREALDRDPASPFRWYDLGEAYLRMGGELEARQYFEQAVKRGSFAPRILMRAANFYFVVGETRIALGLSARCLAGTRDYDATVFRQYERLRVPLDDILEHGLPRHPEAARSWFLFLMRPGAAPGNDAALEASWQTMVDRGFTDDDLLSRYVSLLLRRKRYEEAVEAQAPFYGRGLARPGNDSLAAPATNLLFNPGFERTPSGSPLDWRIRPMEGVEVAREAHQPARGKTALRIEFREAGNPDYHHVSRRVVVGGDRLAFRAVVRAEGLGGDQGIDFQIVDAEAPHRFDVRTRNIRGTTPWMTLETEIAAPPDTRLLEVRVHRARSLKFDNQLSGTLWIDDVSLRPLRRYSAETGPPPSVR